MQLHGRQTEGTVDGTGLDVDQLQATVGHDHQSTEPDPAADDEIVVDVEFSGISTGTERLLWDGRMPPFPGMGYPLVPGYESVSWGGVMAPAGTPAPIIAQLNAEIAAVRKLDRHAFAATLDRVLTRLSRMRPAPPAP